MEKYREYISVPGPFIKDIPCVWRLAKTKQIIESNDGGVWGEDPYGVGDTIVLRSTEQDIDGNLKIEAPAVRHLTASEVKKATLVEGDLIITKSSGSKSHIGKTSIIDKNTAKLRCCYSNFIQRIRVKGISRFYWYLYNSHLTKVQFDYLSTTTTGLNNLNSRIIGEIVFALPPLSEQQAIVSYLDDKCAKLDQLVANKEKEIALLTEMKQRVIADAVTKGLNPDVTMKGSGIPWLPQIPEHWEVKPVRSLLKEADEKSDTGTEELLSLSQYIGITYKKDAGKTGMFEAESTIGYKIVHAGQFVMNIMLAWNGSYAVSGLDGIISPAYCVFNFICECDKQYYDYLLRIKAYCGAFKTASRGIIDSRLRLYPNKFMPFPILCPPLDEQKAIVAHIEEKVSKIDALADKLQKEIESIKEYKQRLISDVVTGQIKVC